MVRTNKTYTILLWGLNAILVLLFVIPFQELPSIIRFVGRLHPLILHFPIVLILVALLFEVLNLKNKNPEYERPANLLLWVGAFSAVLSAIAGYFLSVNGDYAGSTYVFHKWFGLSTSVIAALLISIKGSQKLKAIFIPAYSTLALLLVVTGHFGASLTHGEGFLTEVFTEDKSINLNAEEPVFAQIIQPIFDGKCTNCHNPNKLKGGLLLDSEQGLLKGGESGVAFNPGDTKNSRLIAHVLRPMEDKLHMPPKGKTQLTNEEIELLSWWVETGASFTQVVGEIGAGDPIQTVLTSYFAPEEAINISPADPELIQALNEQNISVREMEAGKPYLDVYLGNRDSLSLSVVKKLRRIKTQIYALDLGNSHVDQDILKEVSRFKNLHRLYLDNTETDDNMISALRKLKKLEYLNLYGSKITNSGAAQMAKLPKLAQLFLWQTEITADEIAVLQTDHPTVIVDGGLPEDSDFTKSQLAAPKLEFSSTFFLDKLNVNVFYSLPGTVIQYQIDGGEPKPLENGSIEITQSARLFVFAQKEGWEDSPLAEQTFIKVEDNLVKNSSLKHGPKGQYLAKGVSTLFDLRKGSENFKDGEWLGFSGDDMEVNIELGKTRNIRSVYISTLDDTGAWIFPPTKLEIWGGTSADQLTKLQELSITSPEGPEPKKMKIHQLKFDPKAIKHLRIRAKNQGDLPEWHPGKGTPAWMFIDEIAFN